MLAVEVLAYNNVSSLQAVAQVRSIEAIRDFKVELHNELVDFTEDVLVTINVFGGTEGKAIVLFGEKKIEKFFTVTVGADITEVTFKHR
jgi:hypothetical protein